MIMLQRRHQQESQQAPAAVQPIVYVQSTKNSDFWQQNILLAMMTKYQTLSLMIINDNKII